MSDSDNVSLSELIKKVNMLNKNIKALTDLTTAINEKFQANIADNVDEQEKIDKIFESRGLGRPKGDHQSKRQSYFEMVSKGRIKQPREQTLEYYKIRKDENGEYSLD